MPPPTKTAPMFGEASYWIGVDPGASGGVAVIGACRRGGSVELFKMPETRLDMLDLMRRWRPVENGTLANVRCFAVVEKVGGFIAGNPAPGSAMFRFGQMFERPLMALAALEIPTEEVIPRTWQKAFGISPRGKGESKTQFKNRIRGVAEGLFPSAKVTNATSDALMLAEYCRRKREGTLATGDQSLRAS